MQKTSIKQSVAIQSAQDINAICQSLFSYTDLKFFRYVRWYNDGSCATLLSDATWQEFVQQNNFYEKFPSINNISEHSSRASIVCPQRMAAIRQLLSIDDAILIAHGFESFTELYCVGIRKNSIKSISYYQEHIELIQHFIFYFKEQANLLLQRSLLQKNRIEMPSYIAKHPIIDTEQNDIIKKIINGNPIRKYYFDLGQAKGYLTKKEMLCLLYYLKCYSAKEIAKKLSLSFKTIETHLYSIRCKFNCKTRKDLYRAAIKIIPLELTNYIIDFHEQACGTMHRKLRLTP